MNSLLKQYGPWALVTGASSGIGAEFARQLAEQGFNLAVVARRQELLEADAATLRQTYGIQVRPIAADLSQESSLAQIESAVADLEIGLLVSNAGLGSFASFLDIDSETERQVVQVNVLSPMLLAHRFARPMVERRRGGIIFTASTIGYNGTPFMANYGATKAYLISLGEALHFELARHNVDVCVLSPGPTTTAMSQNIGFDMSKFPIKAMPVQPVVAAALQALPSKVSVIPGFANQLMDFMSKHVLSRSAVSAMFGKMMGEMLAARSAN